MKLLWALLLMWAFTIFLFSSAILASPFSTVSAISTPLFPSGKESISQVSTTAMEAGSPGIPQVKVVHHHQDMNKKILIALILSSTLLGVVLLSLLCFWIYRLKNLKDSNDKRKQNSGGGLSLSPIIEQFNSLRVAGKKSSVGVIEYQLLEGATNNFRESNLLGEGGRGRVYKACFSEKYMAAVKKIDGQGQDAEKEFQNEVNWLTKIRHQNIISLLGYCIHDETKLLVYEMMQNGSLENQLYGPTRGSDLTWHLRIKIAVDIARGLEYLHEHCNPPLVHRDLKSSNVLLDSNFNAKLSDFGLAATAGTQNKNIKLSGTLGYVAPEYLLEGKLTDKSDVYAFGVVLLELLMGRRPVEKMSPTQCQSVVTWAMPQLTDRSKLPSIVDPVIKDAMNLKHLYQIAAVAVLCIQPEPSYRPLITDVLHSLIPLVPSDLGGTLRLA